MIIISMGTFEVMIVAMSMKRKSAGIDMRASTTRIMIESTLPPMNPATAPQSVPMNVAKIPASRPTVMEVWPPTMRRPSWS